MPHSACLGRCKALCRLSSSRLVVGWGHRHEMGEVLPAGPAYSVKRTWKQCSL
jgi:hypothetical protein